MAFLKNANFKNFMVLSLAILALQVAYCHFIGFLSFSMFKVLLIPVAIVFSAIALFKKLKFIKMFIFVVLIIQGFFITGGLLSLNYMQTHDNWHYQEFASPIDYTHAKKQISCKKYTKHFPKTIPNGAKNVDFYQYSDYFRGSEGMFLKFETNNNYIQNEIKKHKYLNKEFCCQKNSIRFGNDFLDKTGYKFYTIESKKPLLQHSPVEYGIAIKNNTILYYYTKSD